MKNNLFAMGVALAAGAAVADIDFNAGADLRIRQEIMENIPGLPGGGRAGAFAAGKYANWMRFRARAWGEISGVTPNESTWRLYARLADEPRWYVAPSEPHKYAFPDELILDNLFLEAKDLFDGLMDISIGRQDMLFLYGLNHIFVDGTPGDGSRSTYSDMVRVGFDFEDDRRLDLFALYNFDDCDIRWGTEKGHHRALSGLGGAYADMDDWGFGAIWSDKLAENVPYQLFVIQKNTASYKHPKYGKRPRTQRELFGTKVMPRIDEEWSLQFEAMGQVGDASGKTLYGASTYAGANWKSAREGWKPFAKFGYEYKSGSKDAAKADGGHGTWDPMWARGAVESEMFLYGTLYGVGWWSNCHYPKLTLGVDFGKYHKVSAQFAPIFAATQDHLGGGNGNFKGFQTFLRYDFPIFTNTMRKDIFNSETERGVEVFGHVLAEFFNPGDYYETDKPAYFVRWQVDFKF